MFVRSHYLLSSKRTSYCLQIKTSVYIDIHFEGRIFKSPFLCVFMRSSVNGFTKTDVRPALLYENVAI